MPALRASESGVPLQIYAMIKPSPPPPPPALAVPEGRGSPPNPTALACLVLRESELAFLLRSLIKHSPPSSSPSLGYARASQVVLFNDLRTRPPPSLTKRGAHFPIHMSMLSTLLDKAADAGDACPEFS